MYKPEPQVAEGFEPEDYWDDPVEVWPENWEALGLFVRLQTQWNWIAGMGGGGRTGLRYEVVYPLIDRAAKTPEEWEALFADIQVMERAALNASMQK